MEFNSFFQAYKKSIQVLHDVQDNNDKLNTISEL